MNGWKTQVIKEVAITAGRLAVPGLWCCPLWAQMWKQAVKKSRNLLRGTQWESISPLRCVIWACPCDVVTLPEPPLFSSFGAAAFGLYLFDGLSSTEHAFPTDFYTFYC